MLVKTLPDKPTDKNIGNLPTQSRIKVHPTMELYAIRQDWYIYYVLPVLSDQGAEPHEEDVQAGKISSTEGLRGDREGYTGPQVGQSRVSTLNAFRKRLYAKRRR